MTFDCEAILLHETARRSLAMGQVWTYLPVADPNGRPWCALWSANWLRIGAFVEPYEENQYIVSIATEKSVNAAGIVSMNLPRLYLQEEHTRPLDTLKPRVFDSLDAAKLAAAEAMSQWHNNQRLKSQGL